MACLTEQTRIETLSEEEKAKRNAIFQTVHQNNREAIARLEPQAHELEGKINKAVHALKQMGDRLSNVVMFEVGEDGQLQKHEPEAVEF